MALSLPHTLQALLFASGDALPKKRILTLLSITDDMLAAAIHDLKTTLAGSGLALVETATELELRTSAEAAPIIEEFRKGELSRDLGKAGLEALAIILYQQGATRSEIDWIRGVNSTTAIRSLLLRGLVERSADTEDKRRARYTPTVDAYAHLGVSGFNELPNAAVLKDALAAHAATEESSVG